MTGGYRDMCMGGTNRARIDELRTEADYHRQRLDLYRAKLYGGRPLNASRLDGFERAADEAAARLRAALADAGSG
jgi:hypothetical protein